MIKLTKEEAFGLAEKFTGSTSKQINAYWLKTNGYIKMRIQKDYVRKTYYVKQNENEKQST